MNQRQLYDLADRMAERYGVNKSIYRRMIQKESGFNPKAFNEGSGATGIAQVMSGTARDPGFGVKPLEDRYDPVDSLRFGAEYLSALLKEFGGDYKLALAAYNAGPGKVRDAGGIPEYRETQDYVRSILETQIPPPRPAGLRAPVVEQPVLVPPPRPFGAEEREIEEPVPVPPPRPFAAGPTRVPQVVARPVLTAMERLRGA